jgi:hypothetical protein
MRKLKVYTSAIKNLALLVVLGMVCQAMAQDAATRYTKMAPVEQCRMAERDAEIALARSAAPDFISRDAEVLVLGRDGFENSGQREERFRVHRGTRVDFRAGF